MSFTAEQNLLPVPQSPTVPAGTCHSTTRVCTTLLHVNSTLSRRVPEPPASAGVFFLTAARSHSANPLSFLKAISSEVSPQTDELYFRGV